MKIAPPPPNFDAAEQAVLDELGRRLRAEGWANHVTVEWLLAAWGELSGSVAGYELTVDDYANELMARDGLEWTLGACADPLRAKLQAWIEAADGVFIAATEPDDDGSLGRADETSGWWWKRRPKTGPLADSLPHRVRT
ncbi:MAG TPA: hypothetical protein VGH03_04155 [Caulobacteraceae bacterium]|jgi:hypothetical protein